MKIGMRRTLATTCVFAMLLGPANLAAQEVKSTPAVNLDYTRSRWFPNVLDPYQSPLVPEPSMSNSQRLKSLIQDDKLRLSVEDAIGLALENNLDITVARYGPAYAQTDVIRAKSGQAVRGVQGAFQSAALFAGALGGGIGGGGGGGGAGAGGFFGGGGATNLGSVGSFDPVTGVNFGWDHRATPLGVSFIAGVPVVTTQTSQVSGFFAQRFQTGTSYVVSVGGNRQSTTSLSSLFNPQVSNALTIGFNQPLLNGFGYRANARFIRIAKNNLKVADSIFRQQVITTTSQVLTLYWDLVVFRENVRVAERSLGLAQKTLGDNKRQVEIGTLAPIEVVRAESEVAARQQDLIVAQTNMQQQQTVLKTALSKYVDADLAAVEIEPTDALPDPKPEDVPPIEEALKTAIANRPEIEQADLNLRNQAVVIKANRNALLPTLDLFATYIGSGLAGNRILRSDPTPEFPFGEPIGVTPGGLPQTFTQIFHGNYPDYSFGVTLQIPLRNRSAQADAARALLEERQLRAQMQRTHNQIAQEVRNAEIAMIQAKAQIEAARKAVQLARQTLDAEQKKFQLGESTVFLVIQAQRDLVAAEVREVQARASYARAVTQFAQVTGTTMTKYNIQLTEALEGKVARTPNIPGTPEPADSPKVVPPAAGGEGEQALKPTPTLKGISQGRIYQIAMCVPPLSYEAMDSESFRQPTGLEKRIFQRLVEPEFQGRDMIAKQLEDALVREIDDDGCLEIKTNSSERADVNYVVPVEAECEDVDGINIYFLLYVVNGFVNQLEVFKQDNSQIIRKPDPNSLTLFAPPFKWH